jgi:hypothetical protein
MKQKAHCPNCGANLELTIDISIHGELKPEFKWLAPGEGLEGSSESALAQTTNVKKGEQGAPENKPQSQEDDTSVGVLTEYVDGIIYQILSKAGSNGLGRNELKSLVLNKGVSEARFNEALEIMTVRAEIYSLKDEKYRITY